METDRFPENREIIMRSLRHDAERQESQKEHYLIRLALYSLWVLIVDFDI